MEKKKIESVKETLYYEKLNNGLEIFMLPKKNVNNVYVTFNTKYGSIHNEFVPMDKKEMIRVPNGIAHFLEHKIFEQEDGLDPMLFYAKKGADVNAYTTTHNTSYLFYGFNHLKDNLNFLLDFVQFPYFTDKNVEKEKDIIEQEIKMYNDIPYSVIDDELRFNVFKNNPIKYPVAGTINDIKSITKEQLLDCYNVFYHPSNMFLVLTGNFDPQEVVDIVRNNQEKKGYEKTTKIQLKKINEPKEVIKNYEVKKMNVNIPKLAFGIKVSISNLNLDTKKINFYLSILFDILFGSTSNFNEKMKELEYIDSSIAVDKLNADEYILVYLNCDTKKADKLINEMNNQLINIDINEEDLERKKKLLISSEIYLYENIRHINHYIVNDVVLYNKFDYNVVNLIKSLNKKEFDKLIEKIDFSNISIFIINPLS